MKCDLEGEFCLNPFPNKHWFLHDCSTSLLKTLWEKEKLLVTSNFSFSHNIFYPLGEVPQFFMKFKTVVWKLFQFGKVLNLSFGKGLRKIKKILYENKKGVLSTFSPFFTFVFYPIIQHFFLEVHFFSKCSPSVL